MGSLNKKARKVAIYARVSTEHESQISAFDNQVKYYDNIVEKHPEWQVVEKYFDKGITGTQVKKRPSFLKMIEDARHGKFDLIITREVSRFARNTVDTLVYTRELKASGIEVIFISDNISTFDGDGETRLSNLAAFAQDESRKISQRVKDGQAIARQNNVLYGSGNILGYDRVDKSFIINDEQAETVRMIFDLYLAEQGLKLIKAELIRKGRKNSKGEVKWFESTISRILSNPMYIGKQYQNQTSVTDYLEHTIKKNDKSEYIEITGDFKPIITAEEFEKVQKIKKKRVMKYPGQKSHGVRQSNDKWMTLLECGCGASYQQYKWRKYKKTGEIVRGYVCRNRITNGNKEYRLERKLPLDGACSNKTLSDWHLELMVKSILQEVWGFRRESVMKVFQLIKENFVDDTESAASIIKELNAKVTKNKQKLSNLIELFTDGLIAKKVFIDRQQKYNESITAAEAAIKQIEGGADLVEKNIEKKLQHIEQTLNRIIDFDVEKIEEKLINQLVEKVIVRGDREFEWLLNISDIEIADLFKSMINEKLELKRANTIEVRDSKYTFAFRSTINLDSAKAYRKQYNKYLVESKWADIIYSVYIR